MARETNWWVVSRPLNGDGSAEADHVYCISQHSTERQAWLACNRERRLTAEIWGHKLYGPRYYVMDWTTQEIVPPHLLDKKYRRA